MQTVCEVKKKTKILLLIVSANLSEDFKNVNLLKKSINLDLDRTLLQWFNQQRLL